MKITLHGKPKSTNHIYKIGVRGGFPVMYMSNDGKCLKEDYQWQIKSQRRKPYKTPLLLLIEIFFGDRRRRDIDNYGKLLLDSGNGLLWDDDEQIQSMFVRKRYDKHNPRIELEVVPLNKDNPEALVTVTANGKSYYSV